MEELFKNNIFFIYLLACIAIFNYEVFSKRQRILVTYLLSYGLVVLNIAGAKEVLLLITIVMFLYEEYLNTDVGKMEIITKIRYKIVDFIYYSMFQYSIIWMYIAIVLNC